MIQQLLAMTPHGQRVDLPIVERLAELEQLQDQADFRVYLYQKMD